MEFFKAVESRRSVRQFLPAAVPRAALERIVMDDVAAGIEAPSGCNLQLRQYVIVDDPAVMAELRPASRALATAPAAIAILLEPQGTRFGEFWIQDASAAMQNMLLAAVALGYGACWIEGAVRPHEDELRRVLGVPEGLRVWSILSVGKPAEAPERPAKSPFAEVVHHNRFGSPL